ncbi:MAG: ABC transporter ATP-binding protein, partial [Candidatus Hodarchaeota archaeon]
MSSLESNQNNSLSPLLSVTNLVKSYGEGRRKVDVLKGVSFNVSYGEWISIMGPSGSGKTTLLNLIGLLDIQDEGQIIFEGVNILDFDSDEKAFFRSNKIGIVFQNHYLIPTMTLKENVELPFVWNK